MFIFSLIVEILTSTFYSLKFCLLKKEYHSFHLVDPSPYPFLTSWSLLGVVISVVFRLNSDYTISRILFSIFFFLFFYFFISWFNDIILESKFNHTFKVQLGLAYCMQLFIVSEVMFFFSFFWAFFYGSLSPAIQLGGIWPPLGIEAIPFNGVPLLNTILLLSSGVSITWAHKAVTNKRCSLETNQALAFTIFLGIIFTCLQIMEYVEAPFSISDSVYGSTFFMATGFHGFHVFVGTTFIGVCLIRQFYSHFTTKHHFGLIAAIWYWHFVDVVWVFLYVTIYFWGDSI
jgi:cytochrome c oxidase subunit 3